MNILNPGYFDEAGLARILTNLFDALAEGGLIALGSNENPGSPVDGVKTMMRPASTSGVLPAPK